MTMKKEHIYRVAFHEPPIENDERKDFFFSSLSAIYEDFTPEQIGCKVSRLWNIGVSGGTPYDGAKCKITREPLTAKSRNKPESGLNSGEQKRDNNLPQEKI